MRFERLGEKITQIRGISYKPNDISSVPLPEYVPILKANNIQEDGIVIKDLIYIHKSKVRPEQFIKKGDLLLAASSGSKDIVGKNIYFESDFNGSFGAFCKLVRPNENIKPRYVATFFKSVPYKRHIRKLLSGALINNLKNEYIDSLLIPEISDTDQLHIANLLSKAETLITQRKETLRLLDEYLKSTFLEMFGDPVRNGKNWELKFISQIADILTGFAFKSEMYSNNQNDIKICGGLIIYPDFIDWEKANYWSIKKDENLDKYFLKSGDIVMALDRPWITSGFKIAMIKQEDPKAILIQRTARIRCNKEIKDYVYFLFKHRVFEIHCKPTQTTVPHISPKEIQNFRIPIPPLPLQTQFVHIAEKTEAIKSQYQQSLQELENLYNTLSQKAFRGELSR